MSLVLYPAVLYQPDQGLTQLVVNWLNFSCMSWVNNNMFLPTLDMHMFSFSLIWFGFEIPFFITNFFKRRKTVKPITSEICGLS